MNPDRISRRAWMMGVGALATTQFTPACAAVSDSHGPICAFVKFLQTMTYEDQAAAIAEMGFDGIEATVRDGGQVLPERVEEDLPRLVEALRKHDLEITVMASSVNRVDQPHTERVLRTAAKLGVKRYRMAYYRYDKDKNPVQQLEEFRPALTDLVAMNRELGITAVYQNHSGSNIVGAAVWDLRWLLRDFSVEDVGVAFDIRHATVEGGQAWPLHFRVMQPYLGAVYVKDFTWDGRRPKNVPLGSGQVDPRFFSVLRKSNYLGPISLHVEYLPKAGLDPNLKALRDDLSTLRSLLKG